jgi:hypothetical protein
MGLRAKRRLQPPKVGMVGAEAVRGRTTLVIGPQSNPWMVLLWECSFRAALRPVQGRLNFAYCSGVSRKINPTPASLDLLLKLLLGFEPEGSTPEGEFTDPLRRAKVECARERGPEIRFKERHVPPLAKEEAHVDVVGGHGVRVPFCSPVDQSWN